jgi:hypothetical protein
MTHKLDTDDFFIHRVQQECAQHRLNFFLIEPLWVEAFYENLSAERLHVRVLLNMHSEHHLPDDIFHRLVKLAASRGTRVIDPPAVALAAFDKAQLHPQLMAAGLRVPYTVIVPATAADTFELSPVERQALGTPFVIKPSLGYGRRGLVLDAVSERDLARSRAAWPDPHYLLQRRIVPRVLSGEPAYFRVYYVFGSIFLAWWNCFTDCYRIVRPGESDEYGLKPLREISLSIAALTGMTFFSTEIAITETNEFVVIDYVNDQCHLLAQSSNPQIGVPDELVSAIAQCLVQGTRQWLAGS